MNMNRKNIVLLCKLFSFHIFHPHLMMKMMNRTNTLLFYKFFSFYYIHFLWHNHYNNLSFYNFFCNFFYFYVFYMVRMVYINYISMLLVLHYLTIHYSIPAYHMVHHNYYHMAHHNYYHMVHHNYYHMVHYSIFHYCIFHYCMVRILHRIHHTGIQNMLLVDMEHHKEADRDHNLQELDRLGILHNIQDHTHLSMGHKDLHIQFHIV